MHAYLVYGGNKSSRDMEISRILKGLNSNSYKFECSKIEDVKEIRKICRLSFSETTAFILEEIQNASIPALNSLLKSIEEPPTNTIFILTTSSLRKVIPTILSRCKLVKAVSPKHNTVKNKKEIEEFLNLPTAEKVVFVSKIKKRDEALNFLENLIYVIYEEKTLSQGLKKDVVSKKAFYCISALEKNGNVGLQLLNFACSI